MRGPGMGMRGGMNKLTRNPEDWESRPLTGATLKRLLRYVLAQKWLMVVALLLTVVSNLLALAGPYYSGLAIDQIKPGDMQLNLVLYYAAWMAACYVISAVLSYALQRLMILISRKVIFKMRSDVFNKLTELPVGYFDTHPTGDILSRISYDIDTISTSLSTDVVQILASVITVVGALVMMLEISPSLCWFLSSPYRFPSSPRNSSPRAPARCSVSVRLSWASSTALWKKWSAARKP